MTTQQQHICFDLETLGNNPHSPIIQIGAVKFNLDGIYDEFHQSVCYPYGIPEQYKCDYSTIMWWMEQNNEVREMLRFQQDTLFNSLNLFFEWVVGENVEDLGNYLYWSMSTFDAPIINHAIKTEFSIEQQIPFRNFRDFRTIVDLCNLPKEEFIGIKHNALHDAHNEANTIIKCLNKLL